MTRRSKRPDDATLAERLGGTKKCWDAILDFLQTERPRLIHEWKFYGEKHGWQLKVGDGKRAVVYLIPRTGVFTAAMALREGVLAALSTAGLPSPLVQQIQESRRSIEGTPARVEVRTTRDVSIVKRLLALKLGGRAA